MTPKTPTDISAYLAAMGKKGGKKTAERGAKYFKKIAAMRKNFRGGRPPKVATRPTPAPLTSPATVAPRKKAERKKAKGAK